MDPCLFYTKSDILEGIQGTIVDNTHSAENFKFVEVEEAASKELFCKRSPQIFF